MVSVQKNLQLNLKKTKNVVLSADHNWRLFLSCFILTVLGITVLGDPALSRKVENDLNMEQLKYGTVLTCIVDVDENGGTFTCKSGGDKTKHKFVKDNSNDPVQLTIIPPTIPSKRAYFGFKLLEYTSN